MARNEKQKGKNSNNPHTENPYREPHITERIAKPVCVLSKESEHHNNHQAFEQWLYQPQQFDYMLYDGKISQRQLLGIVDSNKSILFC